MCCFCALCSCLTCCYSSWCVALINMVLAGAAVILSVRGTIKMRERDDDENKAALWIFKIYTILGGLLIFCSYLRFDWIANNFLFLKSTAGKGWFNIFLASMFLVTNGGVWGYLMTALFFFCGVFFVCGGTCDVGEQEDDEFQRA